MKCFNCILVISAAMFVSAAEIEINGGFSDPDKDGLPKQWILNRSLTGHGTARLVKTENGNHFQVTASPAQETHVYSMPVTGSRDNLFSVTAEVITKNSFSIGLYFYDKNGKWIANMYRTLPPSDGKKPLQAVFTPDELKGGERIAKVRVVLRVLKGSGQVVFRKIKLNVE